MLGGLLSAFELSGRESLLRKADELGERLLFAFHTPTGLPYGTLGLKTRSRYNPSWANGASTIAEVMTLQLEFRALSRHTGRPEYEAVASRVMDHLHEMPRPAGLPAGLLPMFISVESGQVCNHICNHTCNHICNHISVESGQFTSDIVTLGARADSAYEYLLKQWLLSGRTDERARAMYEESVSAMSRHLVRSGGASKCDNCTYIGSWNYRSKAYTEQMDHLVCFVPGMLALGAQGESGAEHLQLARDLMETCYRMYAETPTGLAPEIGAFHKAQPRLVPAGSARHSLLRPETVESLFIMWRRTGEQRYREWGWDIFEAIERHARVAGGGYAGIRDVTAARPVQDGRMESFFTAETLKYLYLLFGDGDATPLHSHVFNTEAHPLALHPDYEYGEKWGSLPSLAELRQQERAAEREVQDEVRAAAKAKKAAAAAAAAAQAAAKAATAAAKVAAAAAAGLGLGGDGYEPDAATAASAATAATAASAADSPEAQARRAAREVEAAARGRMLGAAEARAALLAALPRYTSKPRSSK